MTWDEQRWVVTPEEARITIAVGPEARLSPELREALDQLARVLEDRQEVAGYMICDKLVCGWLYDCSQVF